MKVVLRIGPPKGVWRPIAEFVSLGEDPSGVGTIRVKMRRPGHNPEGMCGNAARDFYISEGFVEFLLL